VWRAHVARAEHGDRLGERRRGGRGHRVCSHSEPEPRHL
jgi:hypothetical protein